MTAAEVALEVGLHRFRHTDEEGLQEGLAQLFAADGAEREVRLNARDRIDLVVGRVGIEVKVAGSAGDVLRQLARYAQSDLLDGLVLVTTRARHGMPIQLNGKPVYVVSLAAGAL